MNTNDFAMKVFDIMVEKEVIDPDNFTRDEISEIMDFFLEYLKKERPDIAARHTKTTETPCFSLTREAET